MQSLLTVQNCLELDMQTLRYKAKRTQDGTGYKEDTEQMAAAGAFRHQVMISQEARRKTGR